MSSETKSTLSSSPYTLLLQAAFLILSSGVVYAAVTTARKEEVRRVCTPSCLLAPTYMGYEKKAPSFRLKDLNGKEVSLEDYRGKIVLLHLWTKTCAPCIEELPELAEFAASLADRKDIAVLSISTDQGPSDVQDLLKTLFAGSRPPFPVLFDPDGEQVVHKLFGTELFPETWIIDQEGVIRARLDGAREWTKGSILSALEHLERREYCPIHIEKGVLTGEASWVCRP